MNVSELGPRIIYSFANGKVVIDECTLGAMIVAGILMIVFIWLGSGLKTIPKGKQIWAELIVEKVYSFTRNNMGTSWFAPYAGTLFSFVLVGSSLGLIGIRPITASTNVAFALSLLTFLVIQIYGFKSWGFKGKLKEMCEPYPFMFPLKLIEECTLPVSLGFRLFGNIFGGMIIVELFLNLMTQLSNYICDVPFLRFLTVLPLNGFFDMFEPVIQTYIFTSLTLIFLAKAMPLGWHISNEDRKALEKN
ncbi:MAG: F0F1 ATP synthase subunit A [Clostridia bacterium]|nr:F0F1 ATP synthase subunit A [Clostridia bacterium]